ncbi:hypothetical protein [Nostoc sp. UHCC 0252]|nr:hypothetical protein [Nostoc sp. UHCC 0252]MEA5602533.1 hypothetical protein [Nostoc sp. UHCC 0252]
MRVDSDFFQLRDRIIIRDTFERSLITSKVSSQLTRQKPQTIL